MRIGFSVNNVPIRISKERFEHISSRHPEMKDSISRILETLNNPDFVQRGDAGTNLAIKKFQNSCYGSEVPCDLYIKRFI